MEDEKRLYIIGAGFAGQTIADDIKRKKVFGTVKAFLDDDKNLIGKQIGSYSGSSINHAL